MEGYYSSRKKPAARMLGTRPPRHGARRGQPITVNAARVDHEALLTFCTASFILFSGMYHNV